MTVDLDELRQKKAFEDLMEQRATESQEVTTAFLIVQDTNGQWSAHAEFTELDLSQARVATFDDIVGGCSNVMMGCQVQQTALATMMTMEQRASQMQQKMVAQQEANKIASLIDPGKLRA